MQGIIFPLQQDVTHLVQEQPPAPGTSKTEKPEAPWQSQLSGSGAAAKTKKTASAATPAKRKKVESAFQKTAFFILIAVFSAGIIGGALLCCDEGMVGNYLQQWTKSYLNTRQTQPVLQLYAGCFFSMLLLHGSMLCSSFSCIGFVVSTLLLGGKGFTVGCLTFSVYLGQKDVISQILGLLPYHTFSSVLALFMAFAAVQQSVKLFRAHMLHDRTIKYQALDGVYFFLAVT
ncbi:MAG: hypothetical protein Q4G07_10660, partial [Oscillospiraceae bacterium]|nr:hypothetical protein [Oscillospiraceae bacterium]